MGNMQVTAGAFATAGMRGEDAMEDRNIVSTGLGSAQGCSLLAVFDGHRGPQAAEFASQHFESTLLQHWAGAGSAAQALTAAFLDVDAAFQQWHAGAIGSHQLLGMLWYLMNASEADTQYLQKSDCVN
jgi:serine/threonine protein phosphatase PrpC